MPLQAEPPSDAELSVAEESASAKVEAKKRRAKAEAKLRRMCEPKAVSGKMEVDENISQQWADLTGGRDRLIQMMVDAENDKACWGRRVATTVKLIRRRLSVKVAWAFLRL